MVRIFLLSLAVAMASFANAAEPTKAARDAAATAALDKAIRDYTAAKLLEKHLTPPAKLLPYAEAYSTALTGGLPMIAYPASVSHPTCPPGAVCGKTDGKEIIFGYPKGDDIIITDRLPANATDGEVLKAFRKAKARGGPVPAEETPADPFFIDLTIGLMIAQAPACTCNGKLPCDCGESCRCVAAEPIQFVQPCPGGKCPAVSPAVPGAAPCGFPLPMAGPGPVVKTIVRPFQRTRGFVGRFFLPWRR